MKHLLMGCVALLLAFGTAAMADDKTERDERPDKSPIERSVERDVGLDHFAAGRTFTVAEPVAGDLIAAGGKVEVTAEVGGDAVLAGGDVRMDGRVAESLFLLGGQLLVNGQVGRNARVGGGKIEFGAPSEVAGNLSVGGGEVVLKGRVNGYLQAAGGKVLIDGVVDGDVQAHAGELTLGPNARIAGTLHYASREDIRRDPAAQVQGPVERIKIEGGWPVPEDMERHMGRSGGWIWTTGLLLLAGLVVWAMPRFFGKVATTWQARFPMSLLLGFVLLVCIPVVALLFLITVIGVPLGLMIMALYPVLLLLGYVCSGIGIGQWGVARLSPAFGRGTLGQVAGALAGVLAIGLLARVPWLGGVVMLVALLAGVGAFAMQAWKSSRGDSTA
jgi:cytoskeletal protein CcmA (bactofilin family)